MERRDLIFRSPPPAQSLLPASAAAGLNIKPLAEDAASCRMLKLKLKDDNNEGA